MNVPILILLILTTIAVIYLVVRFIVNLQKYDYLGNIYFYIIAAYVLCLVFSCFINYSPNVLSETEIVLNDAVVGYVKTGSESKNWFVTFASSLFDAIKMMAAAFDRSIAEAYFKKGQIYSVFAIYYAAVSFFALITTSISTILFLFKSFGAKFLNALRKLNPNKEIYYIFSDPEVLPAIKLAEELKKDKKIVVMFIPAASLKTQQGTEYRDALKNKGFDVRAENFSEKLCGKLIEEHFSRRFRDHFFFFWRKIGKNRKATVFGLFSNDDFSTDLAINFTNALTGEKEKNEYFYKAKADVESYQKYIKEKSKKSNQDPNVKCPPIDRLESYLDKLKGFKVFVTYQDADMDLSHNFSGRTLHVVNTLSQYDMISAEFVLNNPIGNFVDIHKLEADKLDSFNVTFFGLGKINRPIFEKLTYAYQLWGDKKYLINYHILDSKADEYLEAYTNEFTNEEDTGGDYLEKPVLYHIDADCNGKDLSSYEVINAHIANLVKNENRFNTSGFEIFVISLCNTNTDVKVALQLRQAIIKNIDKDKLSKTIIFVRIGSQSVGETLASENNFVVSQDDLNQNKLGNIYTKGSNPKKILVPIVVFGQNTIMSAFVKNHYEILTELGLNSLKAYKSNIDENLRSNSSKTDWILDKKTQVLGNVGAVYTLKTKLEIFGHRYNGNFENTDDFKNIASGVLSEIEKMQSKCEKIFNDDQCNSSNYTLMKIAEMEHNRWLAASYLLYKYSRLTKSAYFSENNFRTDKDKFNSSDSDSTLHICMTTNKGLKVLYTELANKANEGFIPDKKAFEQENIKLTFRNDIEQLKETLKYFNEN